MGMAVVSQSRPPPSSIQAEESRLQNLLSCELSLERVLAAPVPGTGGSVPVFL